MADRFGEDITNDPRFQPGHAPAGWTNLVEHLRYHRVSDNEMITTGVATITSTGRLIDRFRNRVVFPIIHDGQVLVFIGLNLICVRAGIAHHIPIPNPVGSIPQREPMASTSCAAGQVGGSFGATPGHCLNLWQPLPSLVS